MNRSEYFADPVQVTTTWLSKMMRSLTGETDPSVAARAAVKYACRCRTKVELQSQVHGDHLGPIALTNIEQVREHDLIISQPTLHGGSHPLAKNEPLLMSFIVPEGRRSTTVTCLGRFKLRSGGSGMLYGYRLSLPHSFQIADRRKHYRVFIAFDLALEAEIHLYDEDGAILGVVEDLSVGGAKINARNVQARLKPDQQAFIKITLPDPVGELAEAVRVVRVEPGRQTGLHFVALEFQRPMEELAPLIRTLDIRRANRQRTA